MGLNMAWLLMELVHFACCCSLTMLSKLLYSTLVSLDELKGFFIIKVFDLGTEVAHGDCNATDSLKSKALLDGLQPVDATDAS
jgi:hypothetical protein